MCLSMGFQRIVYPHERFSVISAGIVRAVAVVARLHPMIGGGDDTTGRLSNGIVLAWFSFHGVTGRCQGDGRSL